jgi:hypothetical protein
VFVHIDLRAGMEDSLRRMSTVVVLFMLLLILFVLHIYVPCGYAYIIIKRLMQTCSIILPLHRLFLGPLDMPAERKSHEKQTVERKHIPIRVNCHDVHIYISDSNNNVSSKRIASADQFGHPSISNI